MRHPRPAPGRVRRPILRPVAVLRGLLAATVLLLAPLAAPPALAQDATPEAAAPPLPAAILDPAVDPRELDLRLLPLTEPELARAAGAWQAIVRAKTEAVTEAQVQALHGAPAASIVALKAERRLLFDRFATVLDAWEAKGGDKAAVDAYRSYRSAVVRSELRAASPEVFAATILGWLSAADGGLAILKDAAVVVAAFAGLIFVARLARGLASRWIGRVPHLSRLLQAFVVVSIHWVVLAVGLMVVLSALGVDVSPLFAVIGGASFILAFALQSTLGNLAAGLMIMVNRPFDEGDFVDVGGVQGTVRSVSIMSTTVLTPDNQVIVIPNANVWGSVIVNVTGAPTRRVDLVFGIAYEDSIEAAQQVLERVVAAHPLVLDDPAPVIRVGALGASSVDFICRPWVRVDDYWTVSWDLTRQVKEAFDAAGISIPYPQQDVHLKRPPAAPRAAGPISAPSRRRGSSMDAPGDDGD